MDVEKSLNLSLDEIINLQKKAGKGGQKQVKSPQGRQSQAASNKKIAPRVFKGIPVNRQAGKGAGKPSGATQSSKKAGQGPLAPRKTAGNISKRQTQGRPANQPRRNQPSTNGSKGRQQSAPKGIPKSGNNSAPQGLARSSSWKNPANLNLKITIDNTKAQRPVQQPRQQARPVQQVVMPSRQQFVVQNQAARQSSAALLQAPQYAVQTLDSLDAEPLAQVAVAPRRSYPNNAARPLNAAASYLRDPYRGDDFERTSSQGMRSDARRYNGQTQRKPGGYGDLMDVDEDRYQSRSKYTRVGGRSQDVY